MSTSLIKSSNEEKNTYQLLTPDFLDQFPDFPNNMNALGQFVFLRTYSRYLPQLKRRETYKEVCTRASQYNVGLEIEHMNRIGYNINWENMRKECELLFKNMFELKQSVSGRTLWVGGTKAVDKTPTANFNCSFLNIEKWKDMGDLFYMLLVGTGVGFKCTKEMSKNIEPIRVNTTLLHSEYRPLPPNQRLETSEFTVLPNGYAKIYIGDSKEGWVRGLRHYFNLLTNPEYEYIHTIKISYNSIRPKGDRLKTFGGQASGHLPVKELFEGVDNVLKNKIDPTLDPINYNEKGYGNVRPIHVLDIGNLIGSIVVVGGVRRCVPKGSLVHTKRGLIPIENVKPTDEALTLEGYKKVVDWFDQGERQLFNIQTQDGFFECTENHRMPVLKGIDNIEWIETKNLKPGDILLTSRQEIEGIITNLPQTEDSEITIPELDADLAWLIGIFMADGYVDKRSLKVCLGKNEWDIACKVGIQLSRFSKSLNVSISKYRRDDMYTVIINSIKLAEYFRKNIKNPKTDMPIPDWILQAKTDVKLGFVAGVLDGDGTACKNIIATSIYPEFIKGLQKLLYSCGIESRLFIQQEVPEYRKDYNRKPIHRLRFITKYATEKFSKVPQLNKKLFMIKNTQWANSFPYNFLSNDQILQMKKYKIYDARHKTISIDKYEKLFGKLNYCPVKVVNINSSNKQHTYDITVEDQHNYYCNGYLSHNTSEIFLFDRDDHEVMFAKYGINGIWTEEQLNQHQEVLKCLEDNKINVPDNIKNIKKIGDGRFTLNHRRMSNNSIAFMDKPTKEFLDLVFKVMRLEGEPGFINLEEANRRRPSCHGLNPCAEILLDSKGLCNLTTVNLVEFTDSVNKQINVKELIEAQKLSARCGLRMTLVDLELSDWDKVQKRDRLLGTSMTGIKDAMDRIDYTFEDECKLIKLLGDTSRDEANRYAKILRVSTPLLTTTVKPEGCSRKDMLISTSQGLLTLEELGDLPTFQKENTLPVKIQYSNDHKCSLCNKTFTRKENLIHHNKNTCKLRDLYSHTEKYMREIETLQKIINEQKILIDNLSNDDQQSDNEQIHSKTNEKEFVDISVKQLYAPSDNGNFCNITKFYKNGTVKTKKIITVDGNELESSLNHRYRVVDENDEYIWKHVRDLKVGDKLVTKLDTHPKNTYTKLKSLSSNETNQHRTPIKQPEELTKDLAFFLGMFYGDGSVHKQGIRISCNSKQQGQIAWIENFIKDTFNLSVYIDSLHSSNMKSACSVQIVSLELIDWLKLNKCLKEYSTEIQVPFIIRTASKDKVISFIEGFWRSDGGIHNSGNTWSTCSVSEIFAKQLFALCRSVGYNVKLSKCGPSKNEQTIGTRDRWIVQIRNTDKDCRYTSREYRERFWNNYWLDPIKSIEDSECPTFDIEVDKSHHYLMNGGTVSHNTLSQIFSGVSSGVHLSHSPYYIRRIRVNAADPLAKAVLELGWSVNPEVGTVGSTREEKMKNARTLVIDFPVASGAKKTKFDTDVKEQLDTYFAYQRLYTDHNSSNTITVRPEEWDTAKDIIYDNWNDFVGVSFLQLDGHTYDLAPYEAITEDQYNKLKQNMKPFDMNLLIKYESEHEDFTNGKLAGASINTEEDIENNISTNKDSIEINLDETNTSDCVGGVCPLR